MGRISKLQAVNRMLRAASERPVSTLEADGVNDTDLAVAILEQVHLEHLTNGLHCNTEVLTLTPTSEGKFVISGNYLTVDTTGADRYRDVVVRGDYLYDVENNTDIFEDDDLEVVITVYIDFEDLPTPIQIMIQEEAARLYQQTALGDQTMDQLLAEREMKGRIIGKSSDARSGDRNFLNGAGSYISRRIGYRKPGIWRWS